MCRKRTAREPEDLIAGCNVRDVGTDSRHRARTLDTNRSRLAGVHAEDVHHVAEVEAAGAYRDLDLAGPGGLPDERLEGNLIETTALGTNQAIGIRTRRPLRFRGPALARTHPMGRLLAVRIAATKNAA